MQFSAGHEAYLRFLLRRILRNGLEIGANARLSPLTGSVQFKNVTTGLFHNIWIRGAAGHAVVVVDQDGEA